jgi:hypothetical protein
MADPTDNEVQADEQDILSGGYNAEEAAFGPAATVCVRCALYLTSC